MSGNIIEIKEQIPEIPYRLAPYQGIDDAPEKERDEDSDSPFADKLGRGIVQGEEEIT